MNTSSLTAKRNWVLSFSAQDAKQLDKKGLVFEKEVCRAGTFTKRGRGGKVIKHVITDDDIKHFSKTFAEMKEDGITVPIPLEHTVDPEKRRATVTGMTHRLNDKGVMANFARIEFRDAESAKLAKTAGVSIYVPNEIHNGTLNKTYKRGVEHIALTDYPVITDLGPFKPLALSLKAEVTEEDDVTLRELATQMGVDPSITDEQQIMLAMSQKIQTMRGPGAGAPGGAGAPPTPAPAPGGFPPKRPGFGMSRDVNDPQPLSGMLLSVVRENREMKIDKLASPELGVITPAVAKKLKAQFCDDDVLAFSNVDGFDDGFDTLIATLAENSRVIPNGRKGLAQAVVLSRKQDGSAENPLIRDAERRAAAAKERTNSYS